MSGPVSKYQQNVVFKLNSKNKLNLNHSLIVRTYLSVVSCVSPVTNIELGQSNLNVNQLMVNLTMEFQSRAHIWISVVAFSSLSQSFSAYGGSVTVTRAGESNIDLL